MRTIEDVKLELEAMKSLDMHVPQAAFKYLETESGQSQVTEMLRSMSVSNLADYLCIRPY